MGKGTVARKLVNKVANLWLSRSYTTRNPRPGEPDDAYYFVTRECFEKKIKNNEFLEWAEFLGNYYGTPLPSPPENYDVLLEIDMQGAKQVLEKKDLNSCLIFLMPPSIKDLRARMEKRGDDPAKIEQRLKLASLEIQQGKELASYLVINDDLFRCVNEVAGIIEKVRKEKKEI